MYVNKICYFNSFVQDCVDLVLLLVPIQLANDF